MVAQLLRLRLDLLAGEVRTSASRSVLVILCALAGLVTAVVVAGRLGGLHPVSAHIAAAIVVPVGALITLGFMLVPLAAGAADALDPRRFAVFGLGRRRLALGLGVAALIGVPTVAVAVVAVAQSVTWMRGVAAGITGVMAAILIIATCVLLARVASTVGAWLLASRRTRDAAGLVVLVVVVLVAPGLALLLGASRVESAGPAIQRITDVAGWTPWGAAWAAPADVASGHGGRGVLKLLLALVVVAALVWAWEALVGRLLTAVEHEAPSRGRLRLGWFDRLGATPVGAVAARSLTYWGRDPRYRMSYLVVLFVPIVVLPLAVAGVPWHWIVLVPLPVMALIAGFLPHNDVAHDHTAVWLHVATGAPGWSDRLGRVTPLLVLGTPLLVIGAVVSAWLHRDWSVLPAMIGVAGCALYGGLGLSSVFSAALPYPAVRPGDHPFRQPQAVGPRAVASQSATIALTVLLTSPAAWFAVRSVTEGTERWGSLALVVGLGTGIVVLALGVVIGGRLFDRHGPDILASAQRN